MQTAQENQTPAYLHKGSTPQSKLLEMEHEFNIDVAPLFKAFTTPEALKVWWWPGSLYADHIDWDFKVGGHYFINMQGPNHMGGMTGEFVEIVENKRIVMTDFFASEDGKPITAKEANMTGNWPDVVYITFEFEMKDENTSVLKLSQEGIPNEQHQDCMKGWQDMFDKLEQYLVDGKN